MPRPSRVLVNRDSLLSLYPTDDNGCLKCPNDNPPCPKCADDEECVQTSSSCNKCASVSCVKTSRSTNQKPVGGIVGGSVGGMVVLLLVAGFIFWYFFWRKKHRMYLKDEDIVMGDMKDEADPDDRSNDDRPLNYYERPKAPGLQRPGNRRVSSYESFTRPRANFKNPRARVNRATPPRQSGSVERGSDQRSVISSVSTTNASNILPIAYIPGVTVRPTKNNTKSLYSNDDQSTMDWSALDNASIVGEQSRVNDATMVAIKAQPRLVDVDRIEEEDEEDEEDDEEEDHDARKVPVTSSETTANTSSDFDKLNGNHNSMTMSGAFVDDDSDVDSDIGEIARATSVRRPVTNDKEVVLDVGLDRSPPTEHIPIGFDEETDSAAGSFVFDVEVEKERETIKEWAHHERAHKEMADKEKADPFDDLGRI